MYGPQTITWAALIAIAVILVIGACGVRHALILVGRRALRIPGMKEALMVDPVPDLGGKVGETLRCEGHAVSVCTPPGALDDLSLQEQRKSAAPRVENRQALSPNGAREHARDDSGE